MKKIAVIGATGSIGGQAIDIISQNRDLFSLTLISGASKVEELAKIANDFNVPYVCYVGQDGEKLRNLLNYSCNLILGENALEEGAKIADYDVFLNSVLGISALKPTLIAMEKGARIAMSNKEMIVCAGNVVMSKAKQLNSEIIPVDSEHSAIFQCLNGGKKQDVSELIITSSGGAFRDIPIEKLDKLTAKEALNHPNWNMGDKITIDCATMVNKGFEVIEAMHLFDMPLEKISTVIHRESVVHSMVRYSDGSVIAQMASPDMRLPIQYAFTYPNRIKSDVKPLNFVGNLTFSEVDYNRYPCFKLALDCAKKGGLFPTALMSADSVLVPMYLKNQIKFSEIYYYLESMISKLNFAHSYTLEDVFYINEEVKKYTFSMVGR